jgi:hypothetical protein
VNQSEVNNLVTLAATALAPYVAKYGIGASDLAALGAALIPIAWGIYSHFNMKKVPENATVIGGK